MIKITNIAILSLLLLTKTLTAQVTSFSIDESKINRTLAAKLDSIYKEDQEDRQKWTQLDREGTPKRVVDSLKAIVRTKDSANLALVEQLIQQHGWLSPQDIGFQGSMALFLVIQHADLKTQKKYYPLIIKAEKEGNILSSSVAILEDRIAIREGRKQRYGSQGYYDKQQKRTLIYPLEDVKNLDSLRKSRGLQPMSQYIKNWSEADYQSYLPEAEEQLKRLKNGL